VQCSAVHFTAASRALTSGRQVLKDQQEARKEREKMRIRMMNADPFDLEAQRLIQQEIEQKNIDHNMELAMEASPESFGTVIMLYINCKVGFWGWGACLSQATAMAITRAMGAGLHNH
jgi:hypothetical protein